MKKWIAFVLLALSVLFLVSCGKGQTADPSGSQEEQPTGGDTDTDGKFLAGFSRIDIRPTESLPLAGYGNTTTRMSAGSLDYLYGQCLALTDEEGETVLVMVFDLIKVGDKMEKYICEAVEKETGIDADHIFFNCSHTHSAPDQTVTSLAEVNRYFDQQVPAWMAKAAKEALADRAPARIFTGDTVATGMNFVRHYLMNDGTYAGDNFGEFTSGVKDYADKADQKMQFFSLRREGKPEILCVNWQCHAQLLGRENLDVSPDFVGVLRRNVEKEIDNVQVVYLQGAAGNLNGHSSRIDAQLSGRDFKAFGDMLSPFVVEAYPTLTEAPAGKIAVFKETITVDADHSEDSKVAEAKLVVEYSLEHYADVSATTTFAKAHGFNSYYHASGVVSKASGSRTVGLFLGGFAIGDIGFSFCGSEMFEEQGEYIKEKSPFSRTYVMGYSQDHIGYLPAEYAYDINCYEVNITRYSRGTAELAADRLLEILGDLREQTK